MFLLEAYPAFLVKLSLSWGQYSMYARTIEIGNK